MSFPKIGSGSEKIICIKFSHVNMKVKEENYNNNNTSIYGKNQIEGKGRRVKREDMIPSIFVITT